jgi:nucleoside-triphosphatase THEP1
MDPVMSETLIYLITGGRNAGKTYFCETVVAAAHKRGWTTRGVLTRAVVTPQERQALEVQDVNTAERRILAYRREASETVHSGNSHWAIAQTGLDWANQLFQSSGPCDLLVIDEIGTLEFERGEGLQTAFAALSTGHFRTALVVFRPDYLLDALTRWPEARLIEIETHDEAEEKAQVFCEELFNPL